jgi:hypothetical protein
MQPEQSLGPIGGAPARFGAGIIDRRNAAIAVPEPFCTADGR